MTYARWMHQKKIAAMTKRIQLRMNLLRQNQSAGVSSTTLNHAAAKTSTLARETITLRTVPKTEKIPTNELPSRTIGKMGKLALTNRP